MGTQGFIYESKCLRSVLLRMRSGLEPLYRPRPLFDRRRRGAGAVSDAVVGNGERRVVIHRNPRWTTETRTAESETLLVAANSADTDTVLDALRDRGTLVARVGRVGVNSGVTADNADTGPPEGDSAWPACERSLENREDGN